MVFEESILVFPRKKQTNIDTNIDKFLVGNRANVASASTPRWKNTNALTTKKVKYCIAAKLDQSAEGGSVNLQYMDMDKGSIVRWIKV
jgi:hypothetical protein